MFSIKEKRNKSNDVALVRNRNLEAIVRFTHDSMVKDSRDQSPTPDHLSEINLPSDGQSWEDIIFENRNQEYGAYVVRKSYAGNVVIGLIVTIAVVIVMIAYPSVSKYLWGIDEVAATPPRKLVYTELLTPPSIDKPKPPALQIRLPRLQKVIKFVPPKVVKEEVAELPPTIVEIKENETGAIEAEGPATIVFDEPVEEIVTGDTDELFTVVDQQPEFEGGYHAMMAFIQQNMKYPPNARRMQIEGTVHVSFIVSKTGAISDVKVLRGIMTECDKEAVRVVQLMPAWRPGKQNGRNVNVRFIMPLKFRLD